MKQYYNDNKEKWQERLKAKRKEINAQKRARYASDEATREYYKSHARQYQKNNPERRRKIELMNRYGFTMNAYEIMLERQNNSCAVCNVTFVKTPHVDHCHDNGHVRGLLCFNCNRAIGHFQNDVAIMGRAIEYLNKK